MNNDAQISYWNGDAGRKWADRDAQMAQMLAPISAELLRHAQVQDATAALDVGCGAGSNTLQLAAELDPSASIVGIDISSPLLEVANATLATRSDPGPTISFLKADAASEDLGESRFDLLYSRFGVMFFADPIAAFANLRRSMLPKGRLAFCCWQALADNPWTVLPLRAALTVLPPPEPLPARTPGPFAFAEADYVTDILSSAGWSDPVLTPHTLKLRFADAGGYDATVRELVNTGPVGRLLADEDASTRQEVQNAAAKVLRDYYKGDALELPGAVWFVTAVNR